MGFLDRTFKLKQSGTTVKTEVLAGLTTFMTMAYIIALNPNLLTHFGKEGQDLWNGVFLATCIASAIGTFCMGVIANSPFAVAPGMGLNSFFAVVVSNIVMITGYSYLQSFQAALVIIFVEGVVFLILSILNVREKIVEAIPIGVRLGIAPSIGLMLMNIGFGSNAGIYNTEVREEPFYVMRDFFSALTAKSAKESMGSAYNQMVLSVAIMFIGLFIILMLERFKVKGSVLYGMVISALLYWAGEAIFLGVDPFESVKGVSFVPPFKDMANTTLFKLDFKTFSEIGWFTVITLIITFCIIDMFDTIGSLVGAASRGNLIDENGNLPKMKPALISDAIATLAGSFTGTSTVSTFVESASGIEAGGRTGLASVVTAIMFLLCIFIAPIAAIIPPAATSPALIYVGILMIGNLKKINFDDISQILPVSVMLLAMPITGSIGHGIGLALICYAATQFITGNAKKVSILTFILSIVFIIKFFVPL